VHLVGFTIEVNHVNDNPSSVAFKRLLLYLLFYWREITQNVWSQDVQYCQSNCLLGCDVPRHTYIVIAIVNQAFSSDRTHVMGLFCFVNEGLS
jgi:hypothetical protein